MAGYAPAVEQSALGFKMSDEESRRFTVPFAVA